MPQYPRDLNQKAQNLEVNSRLKPEKDCLEIMIREEKFVALLIGLMVQAKDQYQDLSLGY
jgi:hypothetical protein